MVHLCHMFDWIQWATQCRGPQLSTNSCMYHTVSIHLLDRPQFEIAVLVYSTQYRLQQLALHIHCRIFVFKSTPYLKVLRDAHIIGGSSTPHAADPFLAPQSHIWMNADFRIRGDRQVTQQVTHMRRMYNWTCWFEEIQLCVVKVSSCTCHALVCQSNY